MKVSRRGFLGGLLATSTLVAVASPAFNHAIKISGGDVTVYSYDDLIALKGMVHGDRVTVSSGTDIDGTFVYDDSTGIVRNS